MADRIDGAAETEVEVFLKAPHFSTKGVGAFIRFLDEREGATIVDGALDDAGLPRQYVMAEDRWVSREWQVRFQRALAGRLYQLAELPDHDHPFWQLYREGGQSSLSREAVGPIYDVVRTLGSPNLAYRQLPSLMSLYNRTVKLSFEKVAGSTHRLTLTPVEAGQAIGPALYWNLLGTLERLPVIWDLPDAQIDVEESPFDKQQPSHRLVLKVRHANPESVRWGYRMMGVLGGGVLGALVGTLAQQPLVTVLSACIGSVLALWGMEVRWRARVERELAEEGRQLESLIAAQDSRYQELWDEERKLRRSLLASQKLSGYLPADLVDEILENPEMETTLGGRRTDAAVLFADLVGFTPRTERRSPEDVVEELNLYFSYIDPAFHNNRGVIDKRMGDGVMAVFVPERDETPESVRLRAVLCGLELLRAVSACNQALEKRGGEPLAARVGIAAGPLVQGTMGSSVKFEYTVIGDVVNTAARLEGQAAPNHVVVSAELFDCLSDGGAIPGLPVDRRKVRVKGKAESIEVVEILPLDGVPR